MPRQDIQESLGTRRIKDGTVHRIENLAEPEGTGTTQIHSMAWPHGTTLNQKNVYTLA
jgi:hypothetical protein